MENKSEHRSSETSHVWVGNPHTDSSLLFGFTCEIANEDNDALVAAAKASDRGTILQDGALPGRMWINEQFSRDDRRTIPHLLSAAGFLAVSGDFAEVLSGFDLGRTQLRPVALFKSDRKTPFLGTYFFLNIGEVHWPAAGSGDRHSRGHHQAHGTDRPTGRSTRQARPRNRRCRARPRGLPAVSPSGQGRVGHTGQRCRGRTKDTIFPHQPRWRMVPIACLGEVRARRARQGATSRSSALAGRLAWWPQWTRRAKAADQRAAQR